MWSRSARRPTLLPIVSAVTLGGRASQQGNYSIVLGPVHVQHAVLSDHDQSDAQAKLDDLAGRFCDGLFSVDARTDSDDFKRHEPYFQCEAAPT